MSVGESRVCKWKNSFSNRTIKDKRQLSPAEFLKEEFIQLYLGTYRGNIMRGAAPLAFIFLVVSTSGTDHYTNIGQE